MKNLIIVAIVLLAACQNNEEFLERKKEEIALDMNQQFMTNVPGSFANCHVRGFVEREGDDNWDGYFYCSILVGDQKTSGTGTFILEPNGNWWVVDAE